MAKFKKIFWRVFFIGFFLVAGFFASIAFGLFGKLPSLSDLENPEAFMPSEVYADDGTMMGKIYAESGNRSYVDYKNISKNIVYALLATEDKRFYDHSGVDGKSVARAISSLGKQGGGSTISQQLAKNLLGQGNRNNKLKRGIEKIKEWFVAAKLEKNFSKEEIVTLFLNQLEYSENVFGIRNAAKTFFQQEPDRVSIEEAAVLVGMINNPTIFNPRKNPKAAIDRRNLVLDRMAENTELAAELGVKPLALADADRLKKTAIALRFRKETRAIGIAPYFRDVLKVHVSEQLKNTKKSNGEAYNVNKDGLKIYTTINPKMQMYAEQAVAMHMASFQRGFSANRGFFEQQWRKHPNVLDREMKNSERYKGMKADGYSDAAIKIAFNTKVKMKVFSWNNQREKDTTITPMDSIKYHRQMLQTAFMAMDPNSGEVKCWVGGINYKRFQLDHVTALRQVGSTIKPMLYGLAVENLNLDGNSAVGNGPQQFKGHGWYPNQKNYGGTTLGTGLAYSYNGVAAYLLKQVGVEEFRKALTERYGIKEKLEAYPSICLGADEIPLIQLLRAYTMFPSGGVNTEPIFITKIEDRNGNIIKTYVPERKDVMTEVAAFKMTQIMEGPVTKGTAKGLKAGLGIRALGGKTGTTNDNSDLWFVGYTPQLLAGAWVGCDDRFIRSEYGNAYQGGKAAAPIWRNFFKLAYNDKTLKLKKDSNFIKPQNMLNELATDYQLLIDNVDVEYIDEEGNNANGTGTKRTRPDVDLSKPDEYEQIEPENPGNSQDPNTPDEPTPKVPDTTKSMAIINNAKHTTLLKKVKR
jgi:penicillin-binding protein 1A